MCWRARASTRRTRRRSSPSATRRSGRSSPRSTRPTPGELRDYALLHTLWDTGLRVGELVALTLDDVDLQHREIRVAHSKFGKWRDVGFGAQTHTYLLRYLNLARPEPAMSGERHFFLALDGYPLREATVQRLC